MRRLVDYFKSIGGHADSHLRQAEAHPWGQHAGWLSGVIGLVALVAGSVYWFWEEPPVTRADVQQILDEKLPRLDDPRAKVETEQQRLDRERAERVKGSRIAVVIAKLPGDDAAGTSRALIVEALISATGDGIEIIKTAEPVIVSDAVSKHADALAAADKQAEEILSRTGADLLIWGAVLKLGETVKLKFKARQTTADSTASRMTAYRSDDAGMELDLIFKEAVGATLAAISLTYAAPAADEAGRHLAPKMIVLAQKLKPLLASESIKGTARGDIARAFGLVAATIGEQTGRSEWLEQSVLAFRIAILETARARVPLQWALTQSNLGIALQTLGERETGTIRLEAAVSAYRLALEEITRERAPLAWASTQNNLGSALQMLGSYESGTTRLEEAAIAYQEALIEYTPERAPLEWAMVQNNLGNLFLTLGDREKDSNRFEKAIAAYGKALTQYTQARVPLDWAMTQHNLGGALVAFGVLKNSKIHLEAAVTAYREALKERTRARAPNKWAATQAGLCTALLMTGSRDEGTARLEEAVSACREALNEVTRVRGPIQWAATQFSLALVFTTWFEKTQDKSKLREALAAVDDALEAYREGKAEYYVDKAERLRADILAKM